MYMEKGVGEFSTGRSKNAFPRREMPCSLPVCLEVRWVKELHARLAFGTKKAVRNVSFKVPWINTSWMVNKRL